MFPIPFSVVSLPLFYNYFSLTSFDDLTFQGLQL
jgi:hypothetical protein